MPLLKLLLGVFAGSTAVLWIKLSDIDAVTLTALRLSLASVALAPFAWRDWRRHREQLDWTHLRDTVVPGLMLAMHLASWNLGVRMTKAANGTLIVNLTPLVTPLLLWLLVSEKVTRRELIATAVSSAGLVLLFVADFRVSACTLAGDAVCLGSMVMLAIYLVLARRYRHHPTTLLYVTPLYAVAAIVAWIATPWLGDAAAIDWRSEWPWVALLVLVPTIVGHSLINQAMRELRGQIVSLLIMTQFVFAGTLAWFCLDERPVAEFYPAALLALSGGLIASWPSVRSSLGRSEPRGV
ncbi:MAG: DMT family transporter [Planctomycetota bacterium]